MKNNYPENVEKIVNDYVERVRSHLTNLPEKDKDDFLKEIKSHIYESYSTEKNGDEVGKILSVLKKLGEPSEVFYKKAPHSMYKIGKEKNIPLYILIGALIAIFGLPLGFGGLGIILGILGILFGLIVAYFGTALGFTIGGLGGIFASIIHIVDPTLFESLTGESLIFNFGYIQFSNPAVEGIIGIFLSFLIASLGVLMLFMGKYIFRGLRSITNLSVQKMKEIFKRKK